MMPDKFYNLQMLDPYGISRQNNHKFTSQQNVPYQGQTLAQYQQYVYDSPRRSYSPSPFIIQPQYNYNNHDRQLQIQQKQQLQQQQQQQQQLLQQQQVQNINDNDSKQQQSKQNQNYQQNDYINYKQLQQSSSFQQQTQQINHMRSSFSPYQTPIQINRRQSPQIYSPQLVLVEQPQIVRIEEPKQKYKYANNVEIIQDRRQQQQNLYQNQQQNQQKDTKLSLEQSLNKLLEQNQYLNNQLQIKIDQIEKMQKEQNEYKEQKNYVRKLELQLAESKKEIEYWNEKYLDCASSQLYEGAPQTLEYYQSENEQLREQSNRQKSEIDSLKSKIYQIENQYNVIKNQSGIQSYDPSPENDRVKIAEAKKDVEYWKLKYNDAVDNDENALFRSDEISKENQKLAQQLLNQQKEVEFWRNKLNKQQSAKK